VCCLIGLVVTRVASSNDFPWLLFVDEWVEDLISVLFEFCCCGFFVGDKLGFDIFGGGIVWESFVIRSAVVEGTGVTRVG